MQVHAPRADLAKHRDGVHRREGLADGFAERIAAAIADGPQAKREFVLRTRGVRVSHGEH